MSIYCLPGSGSHRMSLHWGLLLVAMVSVFYYLPGINLASMLFNTYMKTLGEIIRVFEVGLLSSVSPFFLVLGTLWKFYLNHWVSDGLDEDEPTEIKSGWGKRYWWYWQLRKWITSLFWMELCCPCRIRFTVWRSSCIQHCLWVLRWWFWPGTPLSSLGWCTSCVPSWINGTRLWLFIYWLYWHWLLWCNLHGTALED